MYIPSFFKFVHLTLIRRQSNKQLTKTTRVRKHPIIPTVLIIRKRDFCGEDVPINTAVEK